MNLTQIFKGRVSQHILKKISNCSKPKSPKRPFGSRRPLFQVLFQNGNILRKPHVLDRASEGNGQKSELQWTGGGEVFVAAAWESLRFWRAPEGSSSTTSNSGSTSTTNMQLPIMNNSREHHQHQNAATLSIFETADNWFNAYHWKILENKVIVALSTPHCCRWLESKHPFNSKFLSKTNKKIGDNFLSVFLPKFKFTV